jgi:uncharacterized protein YbaP (TraB family)
MLACRVILLWVLLLSVPVVWAAGERLPVWRVGGGQAEMVLLGSIHLAYPSVYPLREAIHSAFRRADTLVVELDPGGERAAEIQQLMLQRGSYPPGTTLQQEIGAATYRDLLRFLNARDIPAHTFDTLRPGLVAMTLTTLRLMEMGMQPALGIDRHFLDLARDHMAIIELETAEQQIALLLDFDQPELLLAQTLSQIDAMEQHLQPLYDAWLAGDAARIDQLLREDELARNPEFLPVYQRLFDDRNRAMGERLHALLRRPGNYFVVVGAGHLVGATGIVSLLQAAGYQVTPL